MSICTFFGHRECPESIKPKLVSVLKDLIENHGVNIFYLGHQGTFDSIALSVLKDLTREYPHVKYAVVLEKLPTRKEIFSCDTLFPEELENVHPRFAVSRRNLWMLSQAEYVVTYITHSWGGAAQFAEKAEKQHKIAINLTHI